MFRPLCTRPVAVSARASAEIAIVAAENNAEQLQKECEAHRNTIAALEDLQEELADYAEEPGARMPKSTQRRRRRADRCRRSWAISCCGASEGSDMDETKITPWPTCLRATAALAVILGLLMLAGCGQTVPKERIVPQVVERRLEIPPSLLTCAPEPSLSAALAEKLRAIQDSGKDVALFVNEVAKAGQDCRSKLAAVRRLVEAQ